MKKSAFISIIGVPNVGKSSVLNRLLGTKVAIISPKPQTTRNIIQTVVTKGDANPREDIQDVHYSDLVGVVKGHIPVIGAFLTVFSSSAGKIYVLIFALCGIMFNILAGRLRNRTNESE